MTKPSFYKCPDFNFNDRVQLPLLWEHCDLDYLIEKSLDCKGDWTRRAVCVGYYWVKRYR